MSISRIAEPPVANFTAGDIQKVILRFHGELAATLALTGLVKASMDAHCGRIQIDVRSSYPDLWVFNETLTPLYEKDAPELLLNCEGEDPSDCFSWMRDELSDRFGCSIPFAGEGYIPLSRFEIERSPFAGLVDAECPFVVCGAIQSRSKRPEDYPDGWNSELEEVRTTECPWVIVGDHGFDVPRSIEASTWDLRGRLSLREIICFLFHAERVITPTPLLMELRRAVAPKRKPEVNGRLIPSLRPRNGRDAINGIGEHVKLRHQHHLLLRATSGCKLRRLGDYLGRFSGQKCWVIGRGPTEFDFEQLRGVEDAVFFINDAVCLENLPKGLTFFFAKDANQFEWLRRGLRSTAVIQENGKFFPDCGDGWVNHKGEVVLYRGPTRPVADLLRMSRAEIALAEELYQHSGTIHSLLHFVWLCGFSQVSFVGCDGLNDQGFLKEVGDRATGYDKRLENLSESVPWWIYDRIRNAQDKLCAALKIETEYIGTLTRTSVVARSGKRIPRIAHFVWVGGVVPQAVKDNIAAFRGFHPDWDLRFCYGFPSDFPEDVFTHALGTHELCMRADLIRLWLLSQFGGIYLDADVLAIRNMDDLLEKGPFTVMQRGPTKLANGVMGAPKSCSVFADLWDMARRIITVPGPRKRTVCGPRMLERFVRETPGRLNLLPEHYFYILRASASAWKFAAASPTQREKDLRSLAGRISDGVRPYGIHFWGIPKSMLPNEYVGTSSSHTRPIEAADAILRIAGMNLSTLIWIGDWDPGICNALIGHLSRLRICYVNRGGLADQNRWDGRVSFNPSLQDISVRHEEGYKPVYFVNSGENADGSMCDFTRFAQTGETVIVKVGGPEQYDRIQRAAKDANATIHWI